jgi:hypothetical protein
MGEGWSRDRIADHVSLRKIAQAPWEVIVATFRPAAVLPSDDGATEDVADATKSPFTEGLLRHILDLTPAQQREHGILIDRKDIFRTDKKVISASNDVLKQKLLSLLQPLFKANDGKRITFLNATAQLELTHHLDLRGKRYNQEKKAEGRPEKLANNQLVSGTTYDRLAEEYHVAPNTIKADGQFADALEEG